MRIVVPTQTEYVVPCKQLYPECILAHLTFMRSIRLRVHNATSTSFLIFFELNICWQYPLIVFYAIQKYVISITA